MCVWQISKAAFKNVILVLFSHSTSLLVSSQRMSRLVLFSTCAVANSSFSRSLYVGCRTPSLMSKFLVIVALCKTSFFTFPFSLSLPFPPYSLTLVPPSLSIQSSSCGSSYTSSSSSSSSAFLLASMFC